MKEVIKGLALTVLLAVVSACSNGTIPNSQSSENQNFGVLSNNDNSPVSEMDGMEGMPGGKMRGFFKELNLTADQKTQFEALKVAQKDHFKSQKTNMDSLKTTLKDAWLSASIDKVALKTKLDSLKPNEDEQAGFMSDNIIKAYNILTVAQRTQVETKLNDMQTKMSQFKNSSIGKDFAGNKDKRFTWFTKDLSLTDAQSTSLKALFDQSEPNKQEMFDKAKKVKDDVLAELKT
ncbi:MAG: Spy/CpxP family protein refolding chaperone, partial [Candidatus Sericytochromatia bacterium]|nr:Spy/CpxP family protein refolding chaperone [Candidatus Sericytochromatia bacterium]